MITIERKALSDLLQVTVRRRGSHRTIAHLADREPVLPFEAWITKNPQLEPGTRIIVTALLERTATYHRPGDRYDTGVVRLDRVFVHPNSLKWRQKGHKTRWNGTVVVEGAMNA